MSLSKYRGSRLDQIATTTHRQPAWRVVIWNPNQTTVQDVAREQWKGLSLDVSQWCASISVQQNQVFETGTDAVSSRATITLVVDDEEGVLVDDRRLIINQRLFADGTPIRIYEGDRRIGRSEWVPVFTGVIRGRPSSDTAQRGARRIQLSCFGRAQIFQRQKIVGLNWDYGTDLGTMAVDVAMIEMGLEREEIRFGEFGYATKHKANALVSIGKMQGLYEIMRVVGRSPYFDAEGLLVAHDLSLFKPPAWSVPSSSIRSIKRVQNAGQFVNSVEIIGLDHRLTKVSNPSQRVAEVNATVGYFDHSYSEDIYYSEDRTRRCDNTYIEKVTQSSFLEDSVSWFQVDEFHGRLYINTGYAPEVFYLITLAWIISSRTEYLTDQAVSLANLANEAATVTAGVQTRSVAQWIKLGAMASYQILMTQLGRYRVFVHGEPFEYVHQEIRAIAAVQGATTADTYERKETMHWLSTMDDVRARAKDMLRREQVKSQEYEVTLPSLPALEVDDVVEITFPSDQARYGFGKASRFYVTSIQRKYQRGPDSALMTIRCWHIKEGS